LVADLPTIIAPYHPLSLTGASGSFEILQLMTFGRVNDHQLNFIENKTFLAIYDQIINADETQRQQMKGLPIERVKLIVVGMALKRAIYNIVQPENLIVSPYALKEGVLREMLEDIEA
jgi:exopolyphosphatase/pppGpp-phosphohydrolase